MQSSKTSIISGFDSGSSPNCTGKESPDSSEIANLDTIWTRVSHQIRHKSTKSSKFVLSPKQLLKQLNEAGWMA